MRAHAFRPVVWSEPNGRSLPQVEERDVVVPEQEQSGGNPLRRTLSQRTFWFAVVLLIVGGGGGAVFAGALASFVQYSNTLDFCVSCHVMNATVYQELQKTPHWNNPSGVRAICSDCHVPHGNWIETLWFKTKATKELYLTITGQVNTVEEFEASWLEMAESVWDYMKRHGFPRVPELPRVGCDGA